MSKRKNQASGCGCAFVVLIIISIAGPFAPIIAVAIGIAGIFYVIKRLAATDQSSLPSHTPVAAPVPYQVTSYGNDVRAIQKKLAKPGRWKTQVQRLQEAAGLKDQIERTASGAGAQSTQYSALLASLTETTQWAARQAIPDMNRHYLEQTEKLRLIASPVRVAKTGQALLDQLSDIARTDPGFHNITETLSLPIRELVTAAQQTNTLKTRTTEARKSERAGDRDAALSEYLGLLYDLKTDNINDDDQANEIADLEEHVRRVVRSYGGTRTSKKTYTVKPHVRRMPNT